MVNIKINNIATSVGDNMTILDAAKSIGFEIPTLCYLRGINEIASCRICVVEDVKTGKLITACSTKVNEGLEVLTESEKVIKSRKNTLNLLLSEHNKDCDTCDRLDTCEFLDLLEKYNIKESKYKSTNKKHEIDASTVYLVRDNNKCILCNRCASICDKMQEVAVIGKNKRGNKTTLGCAFELNLKDTPCVGCGQCVNVCPTGALSDKERIDEVITALNNNDIFTVIAPAPSVRFTIGEGFGMPIGTNVKGKLVTSAKLLGFDKVFDINYGADLTIMEEGTEFIERLTNNGVLPMITSCSPGWVNYLIRYYPEMIPHLSSCKSPQKMFGALMKTYYAKANNIDPSKIFVVTIMPCIAKKVEILKDDNATSYQDVDVVLTAREYIKLLKKYNIDFCNLEDSLFDNPLGSGASVVFGASGGVMEAALRTVSEILDNKELVNLDFNEVRGMQGIKEASYILNGKEIKVAVASGIKNAKELLRRARNKEVEYHFIEIMGCPGGCINGGGQPIVSSNVRNYHDLRKLRAKSLYEEDKNLEIRKAHKNPDIINVYKDYLEKPGSEIAHKILHTHYEKKDKYNR